MCQIFILIQYVGRGYIYCLLNLLWLILYRDAYFKNGDSKLSSFRNCQNRKDVLKFYKEKGCSILCPQDRHFTVDIEQFVETQWGYRWFCLSFISNTRGVAIIVNNDFKFKINQTCTDNHGNLYALNIVDEKN